MLKVLVLSVLLFIIITGAFLFWPQPTLPADVSAEKLVVFKSRRELQFWANGKLIKVYKISIGESPEGHKRHQGDKRTPEGLYYINDKNPNSGYHLNLGISYPNAEDKRNSSNPGGDVKIHGLKNGQAYIGRFHRLRDWTHGCIAVTNEEMDELYKGVPIGTPILIKP